MMTFSGYNVKVPGKLLIAGEYAVLEPNQRAVVMAVDRYVTGYVEPSGRNLLSLPQLGLDHVTWDQDVQFNTTDSRLNFIQNSIMVVNRYLAENSVPLQPFQLVIKSELDNVRSGKKYGLGSSAAVVTAVVSAILMMYKDQIAPPTLDQVFKLAALAHLKTQKGGSGVDIAASVYGGLLLYSPFQQNWVLNELNKGTSISELIKKTWPNLSIRAITPPINLRICVGWTKEPVSTAMMIKKAQIFKYSHPYEYSQFLQESSVAVADVIQGFEKRDARLAISGLMKNREALLRFAEKAGITIETPKLQDLCSIANQYGGGKTSGAGGGDCGIALIKSEAPIKELFNRWIEKDILPLNLAVSKMGASVTEYNCEPSLEEYFVR